MKGCHQEKSDTVILSIRVLLHNQIVCEYFYGRGTCQIHSLLGVLRENRCSV